MNQFTLKITGVIITLLINCHEIHAQSPSIHWQKCIGGSGDEMAQNIIKLADGNFLTCGTTNSTDGNFNATHGSYDAFLLKTDGTGHIIWKKTYGGSDYDAFYNMIELNNGDIYAIGATASNDGQVSGLHGNIGSQDVWLAKLSSNGSLLDQHCYGGSADDYSIKAIKTPQGNIMFAAITNSNDGDVQGNHGDFDGWVVKLKVNGNIDWSITIGDTGYDDLTGLVKVDGGFLVSGITSVETGDLAAAVYDACVAKLNASGHVIYYRKYGGSGSDNSNAMVLSADGNAVLTGHTDSHDGDVPANNGFNVWVFKIDAANNGNILWQTFFGNPHDTAAGFNLTATHDGGFVAAGSIAPNLLTPLHTWDAYAGKVDAAGNLLWTKRFGGNKFDIINGVVEENDHTILMAGSTKSNNGDVHGNHGGPEDAWLINFNECSQKLINQSLIQSKRESPVNTVIFPNPASHSATISFIIPETEKISVKIFDVNGRLVKIVADKIFDKGETHISWTVGNASAGVYFLKIESAEFTETEKIIIK